MQHLRVALRGQTFHFGLVVKGHSFPAGFYDIIMDSTHSFITLANQTNFAERIVFTLGVANEATAQRVRQ